MVHWLWFLPYALIPALALALSGLVPAIRRPGPLAKSSLQHFAAGVVFSVAAVEFLPEVRYDLSPIPLAVSFLAGVAFMLGTKRFTERFEAGAGEPNGTLGFLVAVGVDLVLDGLLLGIGFSVGQKQGLLLSLALALEGLTMGLSISGFLLDAGRTRIGAVLQTAGLALLLLTSAVLGETLLHRLGQPILAMVLSFGLAALLYLVTEELLVEAHEEEDTAVSSAMFFVGFLVFLVLGTVI